MWDPIIWLQQASSPDLKGSRCSSLNLDAPGQAFWHATGYQSSWYSSNK